MINSIHKIYLYKYMQNKLFKLLLTYLKIQRKKNIEDLLVKKNLIITVLGYGITGKAFLVWAQDNLNPSTRFFIIDKKHNTIVQSKNKKIIYLPDHYKKNCCKKSNFIIPSPGFLIDKNEKWYWKIIPELDLFFYLWNQLKFESIIITGSIGKTSLSNMINHYLSKTKNTILCGNIGYPVLSFLNHTIIKNKSLIAVIECSNLQLEHCLLIKVNYFILTNLFENHLNMHKSYRAYIASKLSPIIFQDKYIKKIIISENSYNQLQINFPSLLKKIKKKIILIIEKNIEKDIIQNEDIKKHKNTIYLKENMIINRDKKSLLSNIPFFSFVLNWQIVVTILSYFIENTNDYILNNELPVLPEFRLQKIDTPNQKITIYNDSKSTIIESSMSALEQILNRYNNDYYIYFMIGGLSKGTDRENGIKYIAKKVDTLLLFGAEAKELLNKQLTVNNQETKMKSFEKLLDATNYAINNAKSIEKKSIIIFSPGGSSFDEFESYIDRGNIFNKLIQETIFL